MADVLAIKSQVIGFEIPAYFDPSTRRADFDDPAAFERIRLGYSCGNPVCLARFAHYTPVCPLCGHTRDVAADFAAAPADIQAYHDEATGPGERTVARPMHETIGEIQGYGEMEHIRLSKLKPSRRGRGR